MDRKKFILQVDLVKTMTEQRTTLQVIHLHGSGRARGNREKEVEKKILSTGKRLLTFTYPPHATRGCPTRNLVPSIPMTRVTPSSIVPMVSKWIIFPVTVLRITVLWPSPIVSGKFGAVVRWDERLIESTAVCTRRGSLGRREALVVSTGIMLLRERPEWVLVPRTDDVGWAGWVQELFIVAKDDKEEESGETELDEEGNDVRPSAPVPGLLTPYIRRRGSMWRRNVSSSQRDSHAAASAESSVVLVTGPQIPQFYKTG